MAMCSSRAHIYPAMSAAMQIHRPIHRSCRRLYSLESLATKTEGHTSAAMFVPPPPYRRDNQDQAKTLQAEPRGARSGRSLIARKTTLDTSGQPRADSWKRLIEDMKVSVHADIESGGFKGVASRATFADFVARARTALPLASPAENVEIFYWLSKCAQGSGFELDDDLMLDYASHIRQQALAGGEVRLVRILRTMFGMLNKNKLARGLEAEAQTQLDTVAHELLRAALPRFCARHKHLSLKDVSLTLSIYARMYRDEYASLFEKLADDAVARAVDPRITVSEQHRFSFFLHGPFVVVAYAQARCAHPVVFDSYLYKFEEGIAELTYENVAVVAYAVACSGINRPSWWSRLHGQVSSLGDRWALRSLGLILGACRRLLERDQTFTEWPTDGNGVDTSSQMELLLSVASFVVPRMTKPDIEEVPYHEASDVAMSCALLPSSALRQDESIREMLHCACFIIRNMSIDFPPKFLAGSFHALVAIYLELLEKKMEPIGGDNKIVIDVHSALASLSTELSKRLCICEVEDMELVAQALWAVAWKHEESQSNNLAEDFFVRNLIRVQQREGVRKAHELGPAASVRFACTTAATALLLERHVGKDESHNCVVEGRLLRAWFLPHIQDFCSGVSGQRLTVPDPKQVAWIASLVKGGQPSLLAISNAAARCNVRPDRSIIPSKVLAYGGLDAALANWPGDWTEDRTAANRTQPQIRS